MNNSIAIGILREAKNRLWDGEGKKEYGNSFSVPFICIAVDYAIGRDGLWEEELSDIKRRINIHLKGAFTFDKYLWHEYKLIVDDRELQARRGELIDKLIEEYKQENKCKAFTKLSSLFNKLKARLKSKPSLTQTPGTCSCETT